MHEDGRVVLADFELSREIKTKDIGDEMSTTTRSGTRGFMAPEVRIVVVVVVLVAVIIVV